jgi:ribonuclease HI
MGSFVGAETHWMFGSCSIIEGESIAVLEALHTMEQCGFTHVIIETDSKNVVDAIYHVRSGESEFSFLVSQINNILLRNPNFVVKFVKRQANMAAISWPRRCTFESLPHCISHLMINEII